MPLKHEVRRLGARWPIIIERVALFAETIPVEGVSFAALEGATLLDIPLADVAGIVKTLRGQGVIWTRKNRGEVRVFRTRPEKIAGIVGGLKPVEAYLSASVPHVYRLSESLRRREEAKLVADYGAAQEARSHVAVCCQRIIGIAKGHGSRGLPLADIRNAMWVFCPVAAMEALTQFEPAFGREAKDVSLGHEEADATGHRIAARLSLPEKVAALVEKAGAMGVTKTAIYQSARPKPCAKELSAILDQLCNRGRIDVRRVRVKGSGREGLRFFVRRPAPEHEGGGGARSAGGWEGA